MRVPSLVWGPGHVKPGMVSKMGSTLDLLPTLSKLAGVALPADRQLDGYDLSDVWKGKEETPRNEMFFYHATKLFAARKGSYKMYFLKNNPDGYPENIETLEKAQLFNLSVDPSERFDIADKNPEIIEEISKMVAKHKEGLIKVPNNLEKFITN